MLPYVHIRRTPLFEFADTARAKRLSASKEFLPLSNIQNAAELICAKRLSASKEFLRNDGKTFNFSLKISMGAKRLSASKEFLPGLQGDIDLGVAKC